MDKPKEITVTYRLYEEELKDVQILADQNGRTLEEQFDLMMTVGSKWDIKKKIEYWQWMRENEKKKAQENSAQGEKI